MENKMSQAFSTISEEVYDDLFIYKVFSNSSLLESLKSIEIPEVFTALETFCIDELKVCIIFFILSVLKKKL